MKGVINLYTIDELDNNKNYEIEMSMIGLSDYEISIEFSLTDSFSNLISDKNLNLVEQNLKKKIKELKEENYDELEEFFKTKLLSNKEDLLKNIEYVKFENVGLDTIALYLKNNPELQQKKIIIGLGNTLDKEYLNKIKEKFLDNTKCLYFILNGNTELVNYDDCVKTLEIIDNFVLKVKQLNLSPIEQVMYVYDWVRNKVYTKAEKGAESYVSRDVTSALLTDKIVCAGYSNIFNEILRKLGFNCVPQILVSENTAHQRSAVYIKDDKYEIDGIYFFDPTWDSKRKNGDNNFLLSYKHFAKTKEDMIKLDEKVGVKYTDKTFGDFSLKNIIEFKNSVCKKGIEQVSEKTREIFNFVSKFMGGETIIYNPLFYTDFVPEQLRKKLDLNDMVDKLLKCNDKFEKEISTETFLKILYNVRKNEYYENPELYQFSIKDFCIIALNSNWQFDDFDNIDSLSDFLDSKELIKLKAHIIKKYCSDQKIDKDVESIKLAKTLRKIYESKR